jgi:hypothetical protein
MFRQHNTGPENEATRKEALAMDGSAASLVAMPLVATLGLVAWLSLIAYAVRHPRWTHSASTAARGNLVLRVGQPVVPEPRPADHVVMEIGESSRAGQPAKLAA